MKVSDDLACVVAFGALLRKADLNRVFIRGAVLLDDGRRENGAKLAERRVGSVFERRLQP